jgi:4-alpha-glucanotransferase
MTTGGKGWRPYESRPRFQLPGTRVLQFAFDGHLDNPHLPENYVGNTVVYTGTHDNPPTREWYGECPHSSGNFFGGI